MRLEVPGTLASSMASKQTLKLIDLKIPICIDWWPDVGLTQEAWVALGLAENCPNCRDCRCMSRSLYSQNFEIVSSDAEGMVRRGLLSRADAEEPSLHKRRRNQSGQRPECASRLHNSTTPWRRVYPASRRASRRAINPFFFHFLLLSKIQIQRLWHRRILGDQPSPPHVSAWPLLRSKVRRWMTFRDSSFTGVT
jgi:hypothetical protein